MECQRGSSKNVLNLDDENGPYTTTIGEALLNAVAPLK